MPANQHGNALEWSEIGFLLIGPPGSGKSELSAQLMEQGAELIADDQVLLDGTIATCPAAIRGMLHLRAEGQDRILTVPFKDKTGIKFIFQSPQQGHSLSRPPAIGVPVLQLDFFDPKAVNFIQGTLAKV